MIFKKAVELEVLKKDPTEHTHVPKKLKTIGVTGYTFNTLTSLLAEEGVSHLQIIERLGHKDEDTTKNVYLNVTKKTKKEASQKFKELMENL